MDEKRQDKPGVSDSRVRPALERLVDGFIAAGIAIISVLVLAQVFFRYVVSYSLPWSDEVAVFVMMWTAMAGVVSLMRGGELISFDLISGHHNPTVRMACRWISWSAMLIFAVLLTVMGWRMSILNASTATSAAAEIPIRWVYLIFVLAGAALSLRAGRSLLQLVRDGKSA